jgi:hypothetical protein
LENDSNDGTALVPGWQGGQRVVSPPPRHTASAKAFILCCVVAAF